MNPEQRIKELFALYKHGNLSKENKAEVRVLINDYKEQKGIRKLKVYGEDE